MEIKPEKVFVVHGEDNVCDYFANLLEKEHGFNTYAPYSGTEFDLLTGEIIKEGVPIPIKKNQQRKEGHLLFTKIYLQQVSVCLQLLSEAKEARTKI